MRFANMFYVDPVGLSQGLVLWWNNDFTQIRVPLTPTYEALAVLLNTELKGRMRTLKLQEDSGIG